MGEINEPMVEGYSALGIQHFIVSLPNLYEMIPIEVMRKEVIPAVADF